MDRLQLNFYEFSDELHTKAFDFYLEDPKVQSLIGQGFKVCSQTWEKEAHYIRCTVFLKRNQKIKEKAWFQRLNQSLIRIIPFW